MVIKLENTTSHQTYEYEVVDANNGEKLYFRFDINTADLDEGEYKLDLYDGDEHIATDLLKIGDFNTNTLQYKKGNNTYIAVTLDPNVQDKKQVEIDSINATVSPDVGYTSMAQVAIDAQPLYDSAYNEGYVDGEAVSYANGYDDGLKDGEDIGYNKGFESGIEEQKNQLISISITENGTYNREDGYNEVVVNVPDINGSYDEGFADGVEEGVSNAGEIIAETARVLNITENGLYLSRYSEPPTPDAITGVYPDGTVFYNYAKLNSKVFNTNITATPTTRLELWYKGDNASVDTLNVIIGAGKIEYGDAYQIRYDVYSNDRIRVELGVNALYLTWVENAWHHILIAKETEDAAVLSLWVDEVKVGDFRHLSFNPNSTFYINGIEYNSIRTANGCFGMIKIDDTIIIPTADGFLNTNTGELLEVIKEGSYVFTDNTPQVPEGNLIKTVNVNVLPKINVWENNIKLGESTFENLPKELDFSGQPVNLEGLFRNCRKLRDLPFIDTSKVLNYSEWLYNTFELVTIPFEIVLNKDASCSRMFYYSRISEISYFDTSNVTNIHYMFGYAEKITTLPPFDFSKVTNYQYWIEGCTNLESLPYYDFTNVTTSNQYLVGFGGTLTKLTEIGGFALKQSCTGNYGLKKMPNLTYQSCINQLNALYDFVGNNEQPTSAQGKLTVHQNFLDLVGDEISIGTNKGWTITA